MTTRFYAAWVFVVMLAVVLPIAVPYAIWTPGVLTEGTGPLVNQAAACAWRARIDARHYTHFTASLLALSSSVESCEGSVAGSLVYTAVVKARGPYGIPFASSRVTPQGGSALTGDGSGAALGFLALVAGVALTSVPFAYLWLRHILRGRPSPAVG